MNLAILGVDIAKHMFDVCLMTTTGQKRQYVFANTQVAMERLFRWLDRYGMLDAHV